MVGVVQVVGVVSIVGVVGVVRVMSLLITCGNLVVDTFPYLSCVLLLNDVTPVTLFIPVTLLKFRISLGTPPNRGRPET